jgi:sugar O-acyltransferase (sialic acid O-acetyltransferase NeuD family)
MAKTSRPLLILGTRTFAVEIADLVSGMGDFQLMGFVENMDRQKCNEKLDGFPIFWVDDLTGMANTHWAVCGLATTHRTSYIEQVANIGIRFATLICPSARISSKSQVGEGSIISPGVIIASHTTLGRHILVNRGVLIGHHTEIDDFATIQPGANIAGVCKIGEAAYIGMGAVVLDHVNIGAHSIVGAGAVVNKDVPDHVQVVGVPARIVKQNISGK